MVGFLASKIKDHFEKDQDMIQALVYADSKQVGKSSYCLQTMKEVYGEWDQVFDRLFFEPYNFVNYTHALLEKRKKVPVVMWDDAGVHAGSDLYFNERSLYYDLKKLIQVVGNVIQCLLITSPSPSTPTGSLCKNRNVTIKIVKRGGTSRLAKIFSSSTLPWGKSKESNYARDRFNVMLPDQVYDRYEDLRTALTKEATKNFLESYGSGGFEAEKESIQ